MIEVDEAAPGPPHTRKHRSGTDGQRRPQAVHGIEGRLLEGRGATEARPRRRQEDPEGKRVEAKFMSQDEQDAIVGRLLREKSEASKRRAALDSEIKLVTDTCESVFRDLHKLKAEDACGRLEPIRKYFNPDAFFELLKEKERAQDEVIAKIRQLRELGVTD
jgi:hypothetical protein